MKIARIVTQVEAHVSRQDIIDLGRSQTWRDILGALRYQANAKAEEVGGHVDPTRLPKFLEPQLATHPLLGGDWFLFAAEWYVVVPESFDDVEAARRDEKVWKP